MRKLRSSRTNHDTTWWREYASSWVAGFEIGRSFHCLHGFTLRMLRLLRRLIVAKNNLKRQCCMNIKWSICREVLTVLIPVRALKYFFHLESSLPAGDPVCPSICFLAGCVHLHSQRIQILKAWLQCISTIGRLGLQAHRIHGFQCATEPKRGSRLPHVGRSPVRLGKVLRD